MRILGLLVLLTVVFVLLRLVKGGGNASNRCPHCGQLIPAIGVFCPICGKRL